MHPNDLCEEFVSLKKYSNTKQWAVSGFNLCTESDKTDGKNQKKESEQRQRVDGKERKNELDQKKENAGKIIEIQFHGSKII